MRPLGSCSVAVDVVVELLRLLLPVVLELEPVVVLETMEALERLHLPPTGRSSPAAPSAPEEHFLIVQSNEQSKEAQNESSDQIALIHLTSFHQLADKGANSARRKRAP